MARRPTSKELPRWTVARQIDPLGAAAFLLSLIAVTSQLIAWAKGPEVRLLPVERVALYFDEAPDRAAIVRIAAPISYANVAAQSFGALVVKETAHLSVGRLSSDQQWNAFGTMAKTPQGIAVQSSGTGVALPVPLAGQTVVSHLTLFTPLRQRCEGKGRACDPAVNYISPEQLAAEIAKTTVLHFVFTIRLADDSELRTSCNVTVGAAHKQYLTSLRTKTFYGVCYPDEA